MRYSSLALLRGALTSHRHWQPAWTSPQPRSAYDVVIVGAGGHGLAAAYYLAKNHGNPRRLEGRVKAALRVSIWQYQTHC